ncbi:MAG: hypothetical protein NC221_02115 [Duncaniella sp.]|nr:hypothetical protein [Muribaculum sp.]MCM1254895.1 hypothetical protein [Duncaniella sp.]
MEKRLKNRLWTMTSILFLLCALNACKDGAIDEPQPTASTLSRSISADDDNVSLTNPKLISDWENVTEIELNRSGTHSVTAPWCDGASTALTSDFTHDIRKSDGWDMLFHTFKKKGLDENKY